MTDARVFIDLKEGVIELEGPIDFVEKYLAKYAPGGKTAVEAAEKPAAKRGPGRPPKAGKPARKKKVSCDKVVAELIGAGYFAQSRGFGAIKGEVTSVEPGCSDAKIRKALKNGIAANQIAASGAGRGMKYTRVAAA